MEYVSPKRLFYVWINMDIKIKSSSVHISRNPFNQPLPPIWMLRCKMPLILRIPIRLQLVRFMKIHYSIHTSTFQFGCQLECKGWFKTTLCFRNHLAPKLEGPGMYILMIITCLVGNPCKPSFATVNGRWDNPTYQHNHHISNLEFPRWKHWRHVFPKFSGDTCLPPPL